jgi:hypothetical protein
MHTWGAGALARVLLGEEVLQHFAILEIDRDVEVAGDVGLADVKLLQQGGEKFTGRKISARICQGILSAWWFAGGTIR